jgi:hypothetical protein
MLNFIQKGRDFQASPPASSSYSESGGIYNGWETESILTSGYLCLFLGSEEGKERHPNTLAAPGLMKRLVRNPATLRCRIFSKPGPRHHQSRTAVRMQAMKFTSCLLMGLFFLLLIAPANHEAAAMDKEAKIVFEVG